MAIYSTFSVTILAYLIQNFGRDVELSHIHQDGSGGERVGFTMNQKLSPHPQQGLVNRAIFVIDSGSIPARDGDLDTFYGVIVAMEARQREEETC